MKARFRGLSRRDLSESGTIGGIAFNREYSGAGKAEA